MAVVALWSAQRDAAAGVQHPPEPDHRGDRGWVSERASARTRPEPWFRMRGSTAQVDAASELKR